MYLTKEELIILQGLKNNQTFAEINKNLSKPMRTCDPRIDSLCQKYGVTDRVELVNKADLEKVSITFFMDFNKSKSKWATRIQDDIKNYPDNSFDVLSMNNVLGYIEDDDEYYSTIKNMPRIVKPNGFIITDTICENLFQKVGVDKMLTKISAGIFKKSNN